MVLSYDILPKTKDKIMTFFHPYIKETRDIVTNDDLNNLIQDASGKYKKLKHEYDEFWTFSKEAFHETLEDVVSTLQKDAIDWELYEQSKEHLELAFAEKQYFVETTIYRKAMDIVLKKHIVFVSGEPEMGKTTLGMQLALYLVEKCKHEGKQEVKFYWVKTISTLQRVLRNGKDKEWKIIIYDDFWGSILYRESDRGQEEEELGRLLNKIEKEKKVFFILTTRHYILEQGLKKHEDIRKVVEKNKLECRLVDYSDGEKQRIFYEHIVKGNLLHEQAVALFKSAIDIIGSPNYNPRVIDIFTKDISEEDIPDELPQRLQRYMDKPKEFWYKIFNNLTEEAKFLYKVLITMPDNVASEYVEKVYAKCAELYNELDWKEYSKVIAELEKTVIRTNTTSYGTIFIQFQNPSMQEMVEQYLEENLVQNEKILLASCIYFQQAVKLLKSLSCARRYDAFYNAVMEKAFKEFDTEDIDIIRGDSGEEYFEKMQFPEPDSELPRFLEMCKLYKADVCRKWKENCEQFLKEYQAMIEKFPHDIPHHCIINFPSVAVHALQEGLVQDLPQLLEIYKVLVMRNGMQLDYEVFMEFDQKCCMEHVEKYRVEIEEYIAKYYDYRLCLAAAENDDEDYSYYLYQYEETRELLEIHSLNELDDVIEDYESWIDLNALANVEANEEYDSQEMTFEEIESEYWNQYFAMENCDGDMNLIMLPEIEHF